MTSGQRPRSDSLVIVGSRLQTLIAWISGAALVVGLWSEVGWPIILVGVALAWAGLVIVVRRIDLDTESVSIRTLSGKRTLERERVTATIGHRYLTVQDTDGSRFRIEVPVEIRPDVRSWIESRRGEPTTGGPR